MVKGGPLFIVLACLAAAPTTTVSPAQTLGEALNATNLAWTTGGSAPWLVETNVTHDGQAAVSSGPLAIGGANWIQTTITGPTAVTFWSKASICGPPSATFNLSIGGTLQASLPGSVGWQEHNFYVPPGVQTVLWSLTLNCTSSGLQNMAWLDQVSLADPLPPSILSGPTNQTVSAGSPAAFGALTSGTEPFAFQWQLSGTNLPGANQATFSITNCQAQNAGDYAVVVTNSFGAMTSQVATLTVTPAPPYFTLQPVSQSTILGSSATFSAAANGSQPLDWQWYQDGSAITNATNTLLSLANIQTNNGGNYVAVVSNQVGMATSQVATLTVVLAPIITKNPVSQGAAPGSTVSFQSAALGSDSLAWQWYFESNALAGGTSAQLTVSNVRTSNFGNYWAVATNSYGSATSAVATLSFSPVICWGLNDRGQTPVPPSATNVVALAAGDYHLVGLRGDGTVLAWGASNYNGFIPDLLRVPPDATNVVGIAAGSSHTLAVRTNNTVELWGYILGSGTNSFVPADLTNVAAQALGPGAQHALSLRTDGTVRDFGNAGYGLTNIPPTATNVVSVSAGAYHSLALRADGTVIAWGDNSRGQGQIPVSASNVVAISSGFFHNLALRADGSLVQWGGAFIFPSPGTLPAAASNIVAFACGGSYSLALRRDGRLFAWGDDTQGQINVPAWATNLASVAGGSYNGLALVADGPAQLTSPLLNRSVLIGGKVFFRAAAVGVGPLTYQWLFNGTNISGATNSVLVISNAQPSQAGPYAVVVTNTLGVSSSPGALLTVVPNPSMILTSSLSVSNGQINFLATSPTGLVWAVQGSTNLVNWTDLATLTNSAGTMVFSGVLPASAWSFYRLRFVSYVP